MESHEFKLIQLEPPEQTGGMPLFETLMKRKSNRDFDKTKFLSLKQVSQLLWCAYGPNREGGYKVVPSAIHMNPLILYVFMKCGTFKYCPDKNELHPVKEGDNRELAGQQPFVKDAALNIVIVSDFKATNPYKFELKDEQRLECGLLDAAHCCQNIYLYCASEGLKCVERGMCDREKLPKFLGLDEKTKIMVTLSVGY